jgi:hypothetical protein
MQNWGGAKKLKKTLPKFFYIKNYYYICQTFKNYQDEQIKSSTRQQCRKPKKLG